MKIFKKISRIATAVNGTQTIDKATRTQSACTETQTETQPTAVSDAIDETAPQKPTTTVLETKIKQSLLDNAIDKRDRAVRLITDAMKTATGSDNEMLSDLTVHVIVRSASFDPLEYAWADEKMKSDLRLSLDNAFLEKIGSKSINIEFTTADDIQGLLPVVDRQLYYSWGKADETPTPPEQICARIETVEGTGSTKQPVYTLDSFNKNVYHIGRGTMSSKNGTYRKNDIVINDRDADQELQQNNNHVSSIHADIIVRDNRFYLKACPGGCRANGGSPTKIVRDETTMELRDNTMLYPLEDGDMIELGKSVLLTFSLIRPNTTKPQAGTDINDSL